MGGTIICRRDGCGGSGGVGVGVGVSRMSGYAGNNRNWNRRRGGGDGGCGRYGGPWLFARRWGVKSMGRDPSRVGTWVECFLRG